MFLLQVAPSFSLELLAQIPEQKQNAQLKNIYQHSM